MLDGLAFLPVEKVSEGMQFLRRREKEEEEQGFILGIDYYS